MHFTELKGLQKTTHLLSQPQNLLTHMVHQPRFVYVISYIDQVPESSFSFIYWLCRWHMEVPQAMDRTCATVATRATAVTMLDP